MSHSQFHAKKEIACNTINGLLPPPLKINKESHQIKKSSSSPPSSSSSSSSSTSSSSLINNAPTQAIPASSYKQPPPQQRHPVIIYTHSPKVIHTHPKDFMQLVQKLTGLSRSEEEDGHPSSQQQPPKQESGAGNAAVVGEKECENKNVVIIRNEDETSSVITEENNCNSYMRKNHVNSCFMVGENPMLEHPLNPYTTNLPVLTSEFVYSNQSLLNYSDSLFFSHNMRTSIPSSLEGMKEFRE